MKKKIKKPKIKKIKLTPLKNKLKKLVADYVKLRDKRVCQKCLKTCTSTNDCHASHVIPTSASLLLRYDPINLKVLCSYCHLYWWHKNPLEAAEWFEETFPERKAYLDERKYTYAKYTAVDYQEMIDYQIKLNEEIENVQRQIS